MILTISEKQDLINAKNWDALVQTDFLCDFDFDSTTFKQYTFEHDFVMDFVFNVTRFSAHKDYVKCPLNRNFYPDHVFMNVMSRIRDLNIQITTDDWKVIIKSVLELYKNSKIDRTACVFAMRITNKDANYLRALADDEIYYMITGFSIGGYATYKLNAEEFSKLSLEEQRKVVFRLTLGGSTGSFTIENGDERIFAPVAKTPGEVEKISSTLRIHASKILADLTPDEYISTLFGMSDAGDKISPESWLTYFQNHKEFILTDDQLKKLFDKFGMIVYLYIIQNLTMKMIEDNIKSIKISYLTKRDDLTLNKITELRGTRPDNLVGYKFYTEEEIAANPHFFDPQFLSRRPCLYVTRDTFRLLNEAWGTRQRYNNGLTDFATIVGSMGTETVSISALRYLKSKTKASNEVVCNAIFRNFFNEGWDSDSKKLRIVRNFLAKFNQQ